MELPKGLSAKSVPRGTEKKSNVGSCLTSIYQRSIMFKKFVWIAVVAISSASASFTASAATIKNGVACPKSGSISVVSVKTLKKTYVCTTNPASVTNPNIAKGGLTWTLKTCVSYFAAYKSNQQAIDDQRSLVKVMNEPDRTKYTNDLDASQASLMKVLAAIENNHCKTGL
jgi:hypothetical protein